MKIFIAIFLLISHLLTGQQTDDLEYSSLKKGLQSPWLKWEISAFQTIAGYFYNDTIPPKVSNIEVLSANEFKPELNDSQPFDVIITEIMADPSPSVLLPEAEYLEIYNNSDNDISLKDWKISIGDKTVNFKYSIIGSGDYLILTRTENVADLIKYGNILPYDGFPGLKNLEETITLRNNNNIIIHSVSYSDDWYNTEYKAEGGWSLEMIDTENPCGGRDNWTASTDYKGGTPGKVNSVLDSNPDFDIPVLERIGVITDSIIQVYFNESLDKSSLINYGNYFVNKNTGNPININPIPPDFSSVKLKFDKSFKAKILYTLSVQGQITDCAGNVLGNYSTALFSLPESADSLDLIINEILFDPFRQGENFLEIYNRSEKTIDIKYFNIATREPYSDKFKCSYPIIKESYLLFPCEYIVLTTNSNVIQQQYPNTNINSIIELKELPSFSSNEGILILTDNQFNTLDELHYSENMHFKLLNSTEGVSLERINNEWPTNDPNNWHSSSEDYGFATPGYRNSQHIDYKSIQKQIIAEPEVFSPDNDGYNDFVNILYNFGNPGYIANIIIFDAKGRIVKRLVKNTLLGTEGAFTWDGTNEQNNRAKIGIYLIYTEVFDLMGNVNKFKNTCVLAIGMN